LARRPISPFPFCPTQLAPPARPGVLSDLAPVPSSWSPSRPSLYGQPLPLFNLGYNRNLEPLFSPPSLIPAANRYQVPHPGAPHPGPINRPYRSPSITAPSPLITLLSHTLSVTIAPPLRYRPSFGAPCTGLAIVPSTRSPSSASRSHRCVMCRPCDAADSVPRCSGPPWTWACCQSVTRGPSP
jgi:hypothetical protein